MQQRGKKTLLTIMLALLGLPALQQLLPFADTDKLEGYFETVTDTSFSFPLWADGAYQVKKSGYLNDHTGFREDLVRINDQVDFTLFNKLHYGGGIAGTGGCLFFDNYLFAYCGLDYTGEDFIRTKLVKLKALQDTLERLGKTLTVVYEPSKAYFYKQYLPPGFRVPAGPANYDAYLRIGDSLGIHQLDFNKWFAAMRDTSRELLMTRAGIHWSVYGAVIAGDSIVRYLEHVRHVRLPHPEWCKIEYLYNARQTDDDIARGANLLARVDNEMYAYPILRYEKDTTSKKLNVILIGDSFNINLLANRLPHNTFKDWQFWFYFKFVNNQNTEIGGDDRFQRVDHYDWQGAMNKADVILLNYTSINLVTGKNELGTGFIEQAYDYYYPAKDTVKLSASAADHYKPGTHS